MRIIFNHDRRKLVGQPDWEKPWQLSQDLSVMSGVIGAVTLVAN